MKKKKKKNARSRSWIFFIGEEKLKWCRKAEENQVLNNLQIEQLSAIWCVLCLRVLITVTQKAKLNHSIGLFTVVCLVTWPCIGSEAGSDLVLIQTSLLFICKCKLVSIRTAWSTCEKPQAAQAQYQRTVELLRFVWEYNGFV